MKTTAAAGTAAALMPGQLFSAPIVNSQVRLGFIGTGLRGQWVLSLAAKYPEVKIPAICDIDERMAAAARKDSKGGG